MMKIAVITLLCVISMINCASIAEEISSMKNNDEQFPNPNGEYVALRPAEISENGNNNDGDLFFERFPLENDESEDDEDNEYGMDKRNSQRAREIIAKQAARWDIGFGKRAKSKSFMDAIYGKRSSRFNKAGGHYKAIPFGRKQHWDVQYGK